MPAKQATVQLPAEVEQEMKLLQGFRDLVGERMGYWFGAKVKRGEMNEATKSLRKKANELSKQIRGENLEELITNGDIDGYHKITKELKQQRKTIKEKSEPFMKEITPLNRAVRFLDSVAIVDALKELGTPVEPRFKLSSYVQKAMESTK